MTDDAPLKSAYELAMERLRTQDRQDGVEEAKPLTEAKKRSIARLRQETTAKLAEREILYRENLAAETDPAKLQELEEHYRIDRERAASALNSAIARVKRDA